jgi:hypothetical protein
MLEMKLKCFALGSYEVRVSELYRARCYIYIRRLTALNNILRDIRCYKLSK